MRAPANRRSSRAWPRLAASVAVVLASLAAVVGPLPGATLTAALLPAALPRAPEQLAADVPLGSCWPEGGPASVPGSWEALSDLPWTAAQTGWTAVADVVQPERDVSFSRNPLVIAGQTYEKGLGTYPLSEIIYELQGRYRAFQALVGINDDAPPEAAAVFLVYADGALIHNSGVVRAGAPPPALDLCVAGVRTLRLATAFAGQRTASRDELPNGHTGTYADWAEARVFLPHAQDPSAAGAVRGVLQTWAAGRWERLVGELGVYRQYGAEARAGIAQALGQPDTSNAGWPAEAQAFRDEAGRLVLAHRRLAVALGLGGPEHGTLTAIDPATGALLLHQAGSAINTPSRAITLAGGTVPADAESFSLQRIDDPLLGPGAEARAKLRLRDVPEAPEAALEVSVTLFDDRPQFTYQVTVTGWPAVQSPLGPLSRLDYLAAADPALVVGDGARYFADGSYAREGVLADDGLWRSVRLDIGKPAVVWGDALPGAAGLDSAAGTAGSAVLTLLDEQRLPAWLVMRRDPGRPLAAVGIAQPLPVEAVVRVQNPPGAGQARGPRLLVQLAGTSDLRVALAGYRHVTAALYPPAPLPEWVRYQWGSWWVYGSAVDERRLRQQIDVIADSLGDLGPWHIVVDAGWEDVGPNGSGDLGSANAARFPSGMRALVDYAHARGIRVLLFYSAVYAHDGSDKGEWLGLPGLISEHPDWFIRLSPSGTAPARYLFDYGNPSAKEYLSRTLARFAGEYDADGVKIDGLGDVEGQLIPFEQRVSYLPQRWRLTPVMDIYRLVAESLWSVKPDAFVESGWVNPAAAHPYAHTFRFGDEWNVFDREYPFPGLAQHFTYAAVQRSLLGQRPNIGAVFGGFGPSLTRQWLGAALALGAHVSIGNDLTLASPESLAALRALLVHYRPFAGTTRTGDEHFGLRPNWAATTTATTTGELSFVGLLNREHDAQIMALRLVDALPNATPGATYLAYDVEAARYVHVRDVLRVEVPAQTFRLFVLRRAPGVIWTTSSFEEEPLAGGWRIAVRGPAAIGGRLQLYLPGGAPRAVRLDGVPLPRMAADSFEAADVREAYTYDAATGVLTLRYVHAGVGYPARAIDVAR